MNMKSHLRLMTDTALIGAALLLCGPVAHASDTETSSYKPVPARIGDFSLKIEPGVALPLTHPQSRIFDTGGGETLKALWLVNDYMDVGPSATFMSLPSETPGGQAGNAWTFGGSLRLRSPRNASDKFLVISPWADADLLYVRTGGLNRPGFAAAAGVSVPIGKARIFWVGPFVRYLQIIQSNRVGFDNNDAKILSLGPRRDSRQCRPLPRRGRTDGQLGVPGVQKARRSA